MPYKLYNLSITERSLVDVPAVSDAKILISKSMENGSNNITYNNMTIVKKAVDTERKIYGYALVPNKEDQQGHIITEDEIKKAVDTYNKNISLGFKKGTGTGYEHVLFDDSIGYPILNIFDKTGEIAKSIGIPEDKIIKGGWLTGDQLTEKGYQLYKSGKFSGWSIGGVGEQSKIEEEEENASISKSIDNKSLQNWMPVISQKLNKLLTTEAPSLQENAKSYIINNAISDIVYEVKYQIYSGLSNENIENIENTSVEFSKDANHDANPLTKKKENFLKRFFTRKNREMQTANTNANMDANNDENIENIDANVDENVAETTTLNDIDKSLEEESEDVTKLIEQIAKQNKIILEMQTQLDSLKKAKTNPTMLDEDSGIVKNLAGSLFD